jgi:hypothetical protein
MVAAAAPDLLAVMVGASRRWRRLGRGRRRRVVDAVLVLASSELGRRLAVRLGQRVGSVCWGTLRAAAAAFGAKGHGGLLCSRAPTAPSGTHLHRRDRP